MLAPDCRGKLSNCLATFGEQNRDSVDTASLGNVIGRGRRAGLRAQPRLAASCLKASPKCSSSAVESPSMHPLNAYSAKANTKAMTMRMAWVRPSQSINAELAAGSRGGGWVGAPLAEPQARG